jgi:hypothetical protein
MRVVPKARLRRDAGRIRGAWLRHAEGKLFA